MSTSSDQPEESVDDQVRRSYAVLYDPGKREAVVVFAPFMRIVVMRDLDDKRLQELLEWLKVKTGDSFVHRKNFGPVVLYVRELLAADKEQALHATLAVRLSAVETETWAQIACPGNPTRAVQISMSSA